MSCGECRASPGSTPCADPRPAAPDALGAGRSGASSRSRSRARSGRSLRPRLLPAPWASRAPRSGRSPRPDRSDRSGRVALGARPPRPAVSSSVSLRYGPNPPSARPPWRLVRSGRRPPLDAGRPLPLLRTAPEPGARAGPGFFPDAPRYPPSGLPGLRPVDGLPADGRPVLEPRPAAPAPPRALDARGCPPRASPFGPPFDPLFAPPARPFDPPFGAPEPGRPSAERPRPGSYFGIVFRIRRSLEWCGGVVSVSRREKRPRCSNVCAAGASEKSRRRPTLPGSYPPSTIGAGGLHDRVRNGNGCFPAAIATGNLCSCHRSIA